MGMWPDDSLTMSPRLGKKMTDPVFIVSTGRCGSTMLSNMVKLHPDLLSVSEFFTALTSRVFRGRRPTGETVFRRLNTLSPGGKALLTNGLIVDEFLYPIGPEARYALGDVPSIMCTTLPHLTDDPEGLWDDLAAALRVRGRASLPAHYRFIFEWLAARFEKKVWIERSGLSLLFVPTLAEMFPDARFVHLYRDGRDTAISMSRHPYFRLRVQSEELMMKFGIDPYRPFNLLGTSPYIPFLEWFRFQFFTAERYRRTEIALPAFGRFWSRLIVRGIAYLNALPSDRVLSMRYETALDSPERELRRFIRFIGPEYENGPWLNAAVGSIQPKSPNWTRLSADEQKQLAAACEPAQTLLGYGEATNR